LVRKILTGKRCFDTISEPQQDAASNAIHESAAAEMTSKKTDTETSNPEHSRDGLAEPLILPPKRHGIATRIRNYFLTGIVVAAPIGLTIYITTWFIDLVDNWFTPLIPAAYRPDNFLPVEVPGLGLIIAFVLLTLLGAITANFIGRTILNAGERLVARMPVVRSIYGAIKQIFETVISQSNQSFREVGLIEYPRKGIYSICFITTRTKNEIATRTGHELVSVFVPTTPNPTSGFLLFVPMDEITILDMTIEEGAKMIISAGLVEPPHKLSEDPDVQATERSGTEA
jgi:uncharacterized membrane protein